MWTSDTMQEYQSVMLHNADTWLLHKDATLYNTEWCYTVRENFIVSFSMLNMRLSGQLLNTKV